MNTINRILFISLCLFLSIIDLAAKSEFEDAVQKYQDGLYQESLELFQKLESENQKSAELYYNMGNCFTKLNNVGYAVLYYERALKLEPGFRQAKENLEISQNYIKEPVIKTEEFFFVRFYKQWIRPVHSGIWAVLALISLSFASVLYFIKIRQQNNNGRWVNLWAYLIVLSIIFGLLSTIVYKSENFDKYAIYMESNGVLRTAPSDKSEAIVNLSPGLKCLKLDQVDDWVQVRLMDYQHGWVPASSLEGI